MEHGITFQGIACKVVGGLSFFGVSNNMSLVGSIALLTYLRTCKKWTIDLGKYDYKLFAIISLLSFTLTLIGVPSFGPSGYWCYTNQVNPTTPIIIIVLNFMIIFITVFCYIATLLEVNFRNRVVQKLGTSSRLSRLELIVARKITGYILIFILQWTPTMFYVIGQICGYDKTWMYTLTEVAGNSGGVGNMILFLINEKWRDNFDSLHDNSNSNSNPTTNLNSKNLKEQSSSETLTERSDEYINDGNISSSKIRVHETVTIESKEIF
ncbi:hypothetical protein C2G38_2026853 [Gigaspora rosea]|uniref:G-protein coupled receptors family 1 profile domain-containing protein n=1 Tax=Gigaspora rosea TaxID=44941 RepID=A0A397WDG3_9GLOM|nr:hypothetical protein C2G38_2026853 [Gigaspora rosea]